MSTRVAYFSAEIGIDQRIPSYCGGLGILAGDHLRSAAHIGLPICGITLLYREGYYQQVIDDVGNQIEAYPRFDPATLLVQESPRITLHLRGRDVHVRAYRHDVVGRGGHVVPIYFLDTDVENNAPEDRIITHRIYSGDQTRRVLQEAVLGFGGIRMLRALGYDAFDTYHMNEGHCALLTLELLREFGNAEHVRERCHFTTHTPVPAGHDQFPVDLVRYVLGDMVPDQLDLPSWQGHGTLHMTELGGHFSRSMNGVSKLHGEVAQSQFPMYRIGSITNGIDHTFWVGARMRDLFDRVTPDWESDPSVLEGIDQASDQAVLSAHAAQKKTLLSYVEKTTGKRLDPNVLTLGFARRVVPYKRATLLFHDLDRLRSFAGGKVQIVYAGKAHPTDERSKGIIRTLYRCATELAGSVEIVFLENYRMEIGALMTNGVDVWLNNPLRPNEASGTSGMKAILNGVPNLSTLDGWWVEGCRHGENGWTFGDPNIPTDYGDAVALYEALEHEVIPAYYGDKAVWASLCRGAIKTAAQFTSQGMVERYAEEYYGLNQEA